jgi:MYXO-CTERM domain-containing protein
LAASPSTVLLLIAIIGAITINKSTVEGLAAKPPAGGTKAVNAITVQSDSTVEDCEVDGGGTSDYMINVGIGVMGTNNRILGNYVHDLAWSQSGGSMDNSGGAEGIMVMASNNEIAFNTAVRCSSVNTTLGGFEGGCYEIVNGKALSTISNVSFHHNYCERSIGMWEGCSGDFSATGGDIQNNHGVIENVTVSYNVSVDAMWLFLLQPVNTDFRNVVFANNTIIHTPKTLEWYDASHAGMGLAVATYTNNASGIKYDTDNQYYKKNGGFQPGTIIVKNNIFVDNVGSTRYLMFSTNLTDHSNNIFVPANAQVGSFTLGSTEKKLNLADLALSSEWRLTAGSSAAIDQGFAINMTTNGALAQSALDPNFFSGVFNQDIDRQPVPCGSGVDIGASEYCEGAGGSGAGGGANTSGAPPATAGGTTTLGAGGVAATTDGPSTPVGGGSAVVEVGGSDATSGALTTGGSATTGIANAKGEDSGCSCRVAGTHGNGRGVALVALGLAVMVLGRRRRTAG